MINEVMGIGGDSKLLNSDRLQHFALQTMTYQEINLASDPDEFYSSRERASLAKTKSPFKRTSYMRQRIYSLALAGCTK